MKSMDDKKLEEFLLDPDVQIAMDWGKERNVFSVLGLGEIRHSKMIAWLCDPRQGHLQGDFFIKALLREAFRCKGDVNNTFFEEWDIKDLESYGFMSVVSFTELAISSDNKRRIDVALIDPVNEVAVFIENKSGSGEGVDQTSEYYEELKAAYSDFEQVFVFMDKFEKEAEDNGNWVNLSYGWLEDALNTVLERDTLDSEMKVILKQYVAYLNEDESNMPFFKKPYSLLSKVSKVHHDFLSTLKAEKDCDAESMKQTFESQKVYWLYKKHEDFFDALFEFSRFEYWVEQASKELGQNITPDFRKDMVYLHLSGWKENYNEEMDFWGIQFSIKEITNENAQVVYQFRIRLYTDGFEEPDHAMDIVQGLRQKHGLKSKETKFITARDNSIVPPECGISEIVDGVKFIESKIIKPYKGKLRKSLSID